MGRRLYTEEIKPMKFFVSGCSHVFGHGFADCISGNEPSKYAWPNLLREYGEVIDTSCPGASPAYCQNKLMNFKDKKDLTHLVVLMPNSARFLGTLEGYDDNIMITDLSRYDRVPSQKKHIKNYIMNVRHDCQSNIDLLGAVSYYYKIASYYNLKLFIGCTDSEDQIFMNSKEEFNDMFCWETWCIERNHGKVNDGHFNEASHKDFFETILKRFV